MYKVNVEVNGIDGKYHEVKVEFARRRQAEEMKRALDDLLFKLKCSGAIEVYEVEMQEVKKKMNKTELKKKMMEKALPLMINYQTDLVYDFEVINEIDAKGIPCLLSWQVRDTGTHLVRLDSAEDFDLATTALEYNDWETVIIYTPWDRWSMSELAEIKDRDGVQNKWLSLWEDVSRFISEEVTA